MNDPLQSLARHVEDDPFFLASLLHLYAQSERLDDAGLAAALGCRAEDLVMIRLCRAPSLDPEGFREDVTRVAGRFGADKRKLAEVIRRGQVIQQMRAPETSPGRSILAARDREER